MKKSTAIAGAAVGGLLVGGITVLGARILMVTKGPPTVAEAVKHLTVYDNGPSVWLEMKFLYPYVDSGGYKGGVYAFTFTGSDGSNLNPQAIAAVIQKESSISFEFAKMAGSEPIKVFYDGVLKLTLTSPSTVFFV